MASLENYPDFCTELRKRTQAVHDQSDRLINLKLAVVLTDTQLWADVLADFYFVFQTIERALEEHQSHPHIGPLYAQRQHLFRSTAFERDLRYYLGAEWQGNIQPSEPAKNYCDRIIHVSSENPTLLIAYTHSMYLALVAGGQIISRIVRKTLGLSGQNGLAIFQFEDISRTELRKLIHNCINNLDIDREQKEAIVEEKIRVFQMNNAIANNVKPSLKSYKRLSAIAGIGLILLLFVILLALYVCSMLIQP